MHGLRSLCLFHVYHFHAYCIIYDLGSNGISTNASSESPHVDPG